MTCIAISHVTGKICHPVWLPCEMCKADQQPYLQKSQGISEASMYSSYTRKLYTISVQVLPRLTRNNYTAVHKLLPTAQYIKQGPPCR